MCVVSWRLTFTTRKVRGSSFHTGRKSSSPGGNSGSSKTGPGGDQHRRGCLEQNLGEQSQSDSISLNVRTV